MGVTSEQDRKTRTDLWLPVPSWPVSLEPPPTLLLAILDTLVLVLVLLLAPLLPTPLLLLDRPTTVTPLDQLLLRTELNTESLDREPSRPVWLPLLPVTSTLLPDMRPSPSQPPLMLPEPHRTSSRPEPSPPQPSQLPPHLMLPSHLPQPTRDPPQLIPWPRPESLPRSDPTPESPHRLPTLSHRSRFTNTTLMSQSLSQEPSQERSLLRSQLPSHTRSQSQEPSMSQPHTRSTQSKRLSRPHTSTMPPLRLTPHKLLSLLTLPQSTLSLTPQLLPSLLPQLSPVLDTPLLPQLLLPPTPPPQLLPELTPLPQLLLPTDTPLLPQLPPLSLLKQLNNTTTTTISTTTINRQAVQSKVTTLPVLPGRTSRRTWTLRASSRMCSPTHQSPRFSPCT